MGRGQFGQADGRRYGISRSVEADRFASMESSASRAPLRWPFGSFLSLLRPVPIHDPSCSAGCKTPAPRVAGRTERGRGARASCKLMEQESGRISELNYMAPHKLKKKNLCSSFTSSRFVPKFNQRLAKFLFVEMNSVLEHKRFRHGTYIAPNASVVCFGSNPTVVT